MVGRMWRNITMTSMSAVKTNICLDILIGRLSPDEEISQDKKRWRKASSVREVMPDVVKLRHKANYQHHGDNHGKQRNEWMISNRSKHRSLLGFEYAHHVEVRQVTPDHDGGNNR